MSNQPPAFWRALIMGGLLVSSSTTLNAQRLADIPTLRADATPFVGSFSSQRALPRLINGDRRTYWLEGGVVGGLLLGVLGYELGSECPPNTGSCPKPAVGFLIGASVGFVLGAFLGDTIEKQPD